MSVATETPVLTELPITTDKRTYSRVAIWDGKVDKDGNKEIEYKVFSEEDAKELVEKNNKAKEEADKAGKEYVRTVEIEVTQTFDFDHGNTLDGLKELFTVKAEDGTETFQEKELCKQANNAVDIKLGNRVRQLMLASDENGDFSFEAVEGSFSLREYISQETASRGKTVLEKAKTLLQK